MKKRKWTKQAILLLIAIAPALSALAMPRANEMAKDEMKLTVYGKGGIISDDRTDTQRVCPLSSPEICAHITVLSAMAGEDGMVWVEVRPVQGTAQYLQMRISAVQNSLQP